MATGANLSASPTVFTPNLGPAAMELLRQMGIEDGPVGEQDAERATRRRARVPAEGWLGMCDRRSGAGAVSAAGDEVHPKSMGFSGKRRVA
jgi:hypothetical protein